MDNNSINFGTPTEVYKKVSWETKGDPSSRIDTKTQQESRNSEEISLQESIALPEKVTNLVEGNAKKGTIPIKIIGAGWGASGYYPKEVLQKEASKYKKGTQMFWDHPTKTEEKERPERSLKNLAGVLASDGVWKENGVEGPGIYADAKVYSAFQDAVKEMASDIGISHRASGKAHYGEAEGKKGLIVNAIDGASSVDFVTKAGAKGKVVELFESYRDINNQNLETMENEKTKGASEQEQKLLEENKRLKERVLLTEARDFAAKELADKKLPDVTKQRLIESLVNKAPTTEDGSLDKNKFKETIDTAVEDETNYLKEITGKVKVSGMGSDSFEESEKGNEKEETEQNVKEMKESFVALGYSEKQADEMVKNNRG